MNQPKTPNVKKDAKTAVCERLPMLALAALYDIPRSSMQDILQRAGVQSDGGYSLQEASKAIVHHFRTKAESDASEDARNRSLKLQAEADMAQLDLAEKVGQLAPVEEVRGMVESFFTQVREAVKKVKSPGLTMEHKRDVCDALASIGIPALAEGK